MKTKTKLLTAILSLMMPVAVIAQDLNISGTVRDANSEPVVGATVLVKGTSNGVTTDANGNYDIQASGEATLVFSFLGLGTKEEAVAGRGRIDVTLSGGDQEIEDVVVVGYGLATKESITGSVSAVSSKKIEGRQATSVLSALDGNVAGILFYNSGTPGGSPTIRIRGISTVNGSNSPLYVVDGVPLMGNSTDLNQQDIESITTLKDAASAALYGSKAANGVIIITTKRGAKGQRGMHLNVNVNVGAYSRGIPEYETLNAKEWMETMAIGYRNYLISNPDMKIGAAPPSEQTDTRPRYTLETANPKAFNSSDLINTYIGAGYNIFDKPSDQLFDDNGNFTANIRPQYDDLDWWNAVERVGIRKDYAVNGNVSTENSNAFFSLGYLNEQANIKWADFSRFTGRAAVDITPRTWLSAGASLNGSYQTYSNIGTGGSSYINPIFFARNMSPVYPIYLHDVETGEYILDENGNKQYDDGAAGNRMQNKARHIVQEMNLNEDATFRSTLNGSAYTTLNLPYGFAATIKGSASARNSENKSFDNPTIGDGSGNNGRAGKDIYRYVNYNLQQQLTWDKDFALHHIDVLAGHENYYTTYAYTYLRKAKQTYSGNTEFSNFADMTSLDGYDNNTRTESYLSRLRYNYDKRYYFDASFRRDGSSRFSPDKRWGNFWSAGASWSINREKFFQPLTKYVNTARLRVSYGQVGQDESADTYAYHALYTIEQNANQGAAWKGQNAALDLQWESTNSFNAGLEVRLFDRVNLALDFYDKTSDGLIFSVYNPLSAGATTSSAAESTQQKNLGAMQNRGFEITMDADILRMDNGLELNVSAMGSFLKNRVLTLPEQNRKDGIIDGTKKIMEGHSMYSYWLRQYVGVDQLTGYPLYLIEDTKYYVNVDGAPADGGTTDGRSAVPAANVVTIDGKNYSNHYTYAKYDWSGTALPSWFGSVGATLSWKGITLSALCTYSLGGKVFDQSLNSLSFPSSNPSALSPDVKNYWTQTPAGMTEDSPNRIANTLPNDWYLLSNRVSTSTPYFLVDASYFAFRNLSLSYSLPRSLLNRVGVDGLILSVSAENLYTITAKKGVNPQQSVNGVTTNVMNYNRIISVGLNLKF